MTFRDARREDVPTIVALLADDVLGAEREAAANEAAADDAYQTAFEQIQVTGHVHYLARDGEWCVTAAQVGMLWEHLRRAGERTS